MSERKTEFTDNFFFDNVIDILLTQKCTNIKAFKVEKNSFFDVVIKYDEKISFKYSITIRLYANIYTTRC